MFAIRGGTVLTSGEGLMSQKYSFRDRMIEKFQKMAVPGLSLVLAALSLDTKTLLRGHVHTH